MITKHLNLKFKLNQNVLNFIVIFLKIIQSHIFLTLLYITHDDRIVCTTMSLSCVR